MRKITENSEEESGQQKKRMGINPWIDSKGISGKGIVMQLTGTIEERIHAVVEFGRAHRTPQYDEKYAEEIYEKAGVPFTDAARKFWSEWYGMTDEMSFYSRNPSVPSDGEEIIASFSIDLLKFLCEV